MLSAPLTFLLCFVWGKITREAHLGTEANKRLNTPFWLALHYTSSKFNEQTLCILRLRSTTGNCCRRGGIAKEKRNSTFWGIKKHWNRRAVKKKPQQRLSRSAVWWFTEFCNSHCVSQFAASFIVARAKTSIAESLKYILIKYRLALPKRSGLSSRSVPGQLSGDTPNVKKTECTLAEEPKKNA